MKDATWLTLHGPVGRFTAKSIQTDLRFYLLVPNIPTYNLFSLYYGLYYVTDSTYECTESNRKMNVEMEENLQGSRRDVTEVLLSVGGWTRM
jgi:hypothetical protein